jgi:hypothetical protein
MVHIIIQFYQIKYNKNKKRKRAELITLRDRREKKSAEL